MKKPAPKPKSKLVSRRKAEVVELRSIDGGKKPMRISPSALALSKVKRRPQELAQATWQRLPSVPPGVGPQRDKPNLVAFDESVSAVGNWAANSYPSFAFSEGVTFLGYTYLAELSQRVEYRNLVDILSTEMTRKWIKFSSVSEDKNKDDKIKELNDAVDAFKLRAVACLALQTDNYFGRSHVYVDTGATDEPEELLMPIGTGRDKMSQRKVRRGSLKAFRPVEPVWTYPAEYNSNDPLKPNWYNPQSWFVMGKQLHRTRLLKLVQRPVPDILKPSYSFGGMSVTQLVKPYVDNWLRTRQSVSDMIHTYSTSGIKTDLSTSVQGDGNQLFDRVALLNNLRDNSGFMLLNKDTEEYFNVAVPLGTLDALQSQSQEQMCSAGRVPVVKLLGIQPDGMNASSQGEIDTFEASIHAAQEQHLRPLLTPMIDFVQLHLWGEVDQDIIFGFEPLKEMTSKELAEIEKLKAEVDDLHINASVISAEEVRRRIAADPNSGYSGLDPDEMPEVEDEPGGGEEDLGGRGLDPGEARPKPKPEEGGAQDEAKFEESDHPRAPDGKFGTGSGGGAHTAPMSVNDVGKFVRDLFNTGKPLHPDDLKQVGPQMGSNEGGVFEDKSGDQYYVKKSKSPEHTTNELTAAALYNLAGAPTLKYREAGDDHVATQLEKASKKTIAEFTPAERREAQKQFAVHAWLANWDAAGTGGDNQNVIGGKPTTVDVGGALNYRAQGAPKGDAFGNAVPELSTLIDPSKNPYGAKLFGDMTDQQKLESMKAVTSIPDESIKNVVSAMGGDAELAQKLIKRKQYIGDVAGFLTDEIADAKAAAPKINSTPTPQPADMDAPAPVKAALSQKVNGSSAERVSLRKMLQDLSPKYTAAKVALQSKIIESFQVGLSKAKTKEKAAELSAKLAQYKLKYGMSGVIEKPKTVAAANAGVPEQTQKAATEVMKSAGAQHTPDEVASFNDLCEIGGEYNAKQWAAIAKAEYAKLGGKHDLTVGDLTHLVAYTKSAYKKVNQELRAGSYAKGTFRHANALNAVLDKLPAYKQTTYRKTKLTPEQVALYKPGNIITERGFTSSAKTTDVWSGDVRMEMRGKTGRDVSSLSGTGSHEKEVLFKYGTHFNVISNVTKGGLTHIVVEEI